MNTRMKNNQPFAFARRDLMEFYYQTKVGIHAQVL